ncbi:hypothetical protein TCE0_004f00213 [Talaromyces pinophilus]|uniref:Nucleoside phosphorylase domain-containing protein n=1 Tax=Talaromyces pinophilus TaxID=128442 RepID=A0A0B8N3D0_TALPI|nr:hypothetical protein TCE0_004f00213 [Talaromyces pinophilus]
MKRRRLSCEDYVVGWVCALSIELAAAALVLDEEHDDIPSDNSTDTNLYTLGRIGEHNVVVACLPAGQMGTNSAAVVAGQMKARFTAIRFSLLVGIGGGVPTPETDIRLGDVVISLPEKEYGGVVQYDLGKEFPAGFERTGALNTPPTILLSAVSKLKANHYRGLTQITKFLSVFHNIPTFSRENTGDDILFESTYEHTGKEKSCDFCNRDRQIQRKPRKDEQIEIHYGTIASGNKVIRDGITRNELSAALKGVLCFEMEAAGLMNSFPCLVIRGICDYADSHKNDRWQPFAAATAAACAKEVLSVIPSPDVVGMHTIGDHIETGQLEARKDNGHNSIILENETKVDIKNFAYSFLVDLNFTSRLTEAMDYIITNAHGVFLWVQLVGQELIIYEEEGHSENDIFDFLQSLPTELERFYTLMFNKMKRKASDVRDGVKIFRFVLFAKRPLALDEALHVFGVPDDPNVDFNISIEVFRRSIPSDISRRLIHCGGNFLEIRSENDGVITHSQRLPARTSELPRSGTVQVIHQTVREYFLGRSGSVWNSEFKMKRKEAHHTIAITCVRYLMLWAANNTLAERIRNFQSWSPENFDDFIRYVDSMPFANYALCFLKYHIGGCERSPLAYLLGDWADSNLNESILHWSAASVARVFRNKCLLIAAQKGLSTATEALLTLGVEMDIKDDEDRSPLSWAAKSGYETVVNVLLGHKADIESMDKFRQTPLSWAAENGHEGVVRLLLAKSANLESTDEMGRTPLAWASRNGHLGVVKLLVDNGASKESSDQNSQTPLSLAMAKDHKAVIKLLHEHNVARKDAP